MRPKLSVIVPCYNCRNTVERTLDSLAAQTLKDLELIVINDGSTDDTLQVLEKYGEKHPELNIRLLTKENEGIAAARTFGMEQVTGEYIGFLDSDDYTEPGMFAEMTEKADSENLDVVVSDFFWENSKGSRIQKEGPYGTGCDMMVNLFAVLWNKIYRTDFIRTLDFTFPYGNRYEDACYLYCMTPYVKRIGFMNKPYVHYVQQETSITHTNNSQVKNMIAVFRIILDYYRSHGFLEEYRDALEYVHIRFFLGNSFLRSARIADSKDRRETIMLGWNLLNSEFPQWKKNPYLRSAGGMKNRYFRMVSGWNIMLFAWVFRHFLPDNL